MPLPTLKASICLDTGVRTLRASPTYLVNTRGSRKRALTWYHRWVTSYSEPKPALTVTGSPLLDVHHGPRPNWLACTGNMAVKLKHHPRNDPDVHKVSSSKHASRSGIANDSPSFRILHKESDTLCVPTLGIELVWDAYLHMASKYR